MKCRGHFDLAGFSDLFASKVCALEDAHGAGRLREVVGALADASILGVHLVAAYTRLADVETPSPLRRPAVDGLLLQFRTALREPTCVAETAKPSLTWCEAEPEEVGAWTVGRRCRIERVAARVGEGAPVMLRLDQLISARAWGIGFRFDEAEVADELARALAEAAVRSFGRDLGDVQRIVRRFVPESDADEIRMVPRPEQRQFERLMLDILNEDERRASAARLREDFMEKTDLRVSYPGLDRKKGGRVQVTQTSGRSHHAAKLDAIRRVNELVVLSPLTLADYIVDSRGDSEVSRSIAEDLNRVGQGVDDAGADTLAMRLRARFLEAIDQPHTSPAGPLAQVAAPLRRVVRAWVESETRRATGELREREEAEGRVRPARKERKRSVAAPAPAGCDVGDGCAQAAEAAKKKRRRARGEAQIAALRSLKPGQTLEGVVECVRDYGLFVRIGEAVGLAHHTQMRPPHTAETVVGLAPGSPVRVEVLQVDTDEILLALALV